MTSIIFFVPGHAKGQGSLRSFRHPRTGAIITPQDKRVISWRGVVSTYASGAMAGKPPIESAVSITLEFHMIRPKNHFRSGKNSEQLRPEAALYPIGRNCGDGDKLMRSVLDALTGVVYKDDSQVAIWSGSKSYTTRAEELEGVWITVNEIS